MELIEQNESCTEIKRDCKAKGKESLTRTEGRGDETEEGGYGEVRQERGDHEPKQRAGKGGGEGGGQEYRWEGINMCTCIYMCVCARVCVVSE